MAPCPRWKLVIELGEENRKIPDSEENLIESLNTTREQAIDNNVVKETKDSRIYDVVSLLGEYMPSDPSSHLGSYIDGFMAMRLMMLKPSMNDTEKELVQTLIASYSSYTAAGRSKAEVAVLLARDCMFLVQQQNQIQPQVFSPMQGNHMSPSNGPNSGYVPNIKPYMQ